MRIRYKHLFLSLGVLIATGCSKSDPGVTEPIPNPGIVSPDKRPDTEFDFTQELSDPTTRYVSDELTMRYDSCGIMVTRTDKSIRFVDFERGHDVVISSPTPLVKGNLADGTTVIENGKTLTLQSIKVEQITSSAIYLNIFTAGNRRIIVAVTDL